MKKKKPTPLLEFHGSIHHYLGKLYLELSDTSKAISVVMKSHEEIHKMIGELRYLAYKLEAEDDKWEDEE